MSGLGAAACRLGVVLIAVALALPAAAQDSLKFGRFGEVAVYGDAHSAKQIVLFVSGDGGWNEGVVDMARDLADRGALVVGIDIRRYLSAINGAKEACAYPAGDFEALSQALQKKLALPRYRPPLLIGYSSGATLVFATLAQAPPNTFSGAVSLGFCPELKLARPMCPGSGLKSALAPDRRKLEFSPSTLPAHWVVLQGEIDQVCKPGATAQFVAAVPGATLVDLPKVGHGFSKPEHWLPQLRAAVAQFASETEPAHAVDAAVNDLPIVELPPTAAGDTLAVIVSGDGGWASIDKSLGETFADEGIPVVGLNSLQYFWKKRDPDEAARDLERILRHYLAAWKRQRVLLVGYSTGADVLPFMAARLPPELRAQLALVALLSPSPHASFEFHVGQWLGAGAGDTRPVKPEVEKLAGVRVLCLYGDHETDTLCPGLGGLAIIEQRHGGHHYDRDFRALAADILRAAR